MSQRGYKRKLAHENIKEFFNLLKREDLKEFHKSYRRQILEIAKRFNIRLNREQKLKFCKHCFREWPKECKIRLNPKEKCICYICKCGHIKRIRYK